MKINADKFIATVGKVKLSPIYLVTGDETLICHQVMDLIRGQLDESGYQERSKFVYQRGFDWSQLTNEIANLSLFANRKLVELQLMSSKIGDSGSQILTAIASNPLEDVVLLINCGKLEQAQWRTKWIKAIEKAGVIVQVWPIDSSQLPQWIAGRARQRKLNLTRTAIDIIAQRAEGNLLAAAQEVEKLWLSYGEGAIDESVVRDSIGDSCRFSIYSLVDYCLSGHVVKAVRVLESLKSEGTEPILILWALSREIRNLAKMAQRISCGENSELIFNEYRIWERRKPLMASAIRRHALSTWIDLVNKCGNIDLTIKGINSANMWDQLLAVTSEFSGHRLFGRV